MILELTCNAITLHTKINNKNIYGLKLCQKVRNYIEWLQCYDKDFRPQNIEIKILDE